MIFPIFHGINAIFRYSIELFQAPQGRSEEPIESSPEPVPPVPPERTRKSTSPSVVNGGSKRQTVIPERRKKTEQPMFLLRKLKDQAQALGDPIVDTGELHLIFIKDCL